MRDEKATKAIDTDILDMEIRQELGDVFTGLSTDGKFDVTMHFAEEATEEQVARARQLLEAHVVVERPRKKTFDERLKALEDEVFKIKAQTAKR